MVTIARRRDPQLSILGSGLSRSMVRLNPTLRGYNEVRHHRPVLYMILAAGLSTLMLACTGASGSPPVSVGSAPSTPTSDAGDAWYEIGFLSGRELRHPSNLILLSGESILDVDSGRAQRVSGLPHHNDQTAWGFSAGDQAFIQVQCSACSNPEVFSFDGSLGQATSIGHGFAAPADDGIWFTKFPTDSTCLLMKTTFGGATLIQERPFDCGLTLVEQSSLGLVAFATDGTWALIDPDTLEPSFTAPRILAVIDERILVSDQSGVALVDPATDSETRTFLPTEVGQPSYGVPSPDGKVVAISFEHPAWPGPRQRMDVWLLEVDTMEWSRLPSMPVAAALKATDLDWTPDGRLVIFGSFENIGHAIAVWEPGQTELQVLVTQFDPTGSLVANTTD